MPSPNLYNFRQWGPFAYVEAGPALKSYYRGVLAGHAFGPFGQLSVGYEDVPKGEKFVQFDWVHMRSGLHIMLKVGNMLSLPKGSNFRALRIIGAITTRRRPQEALNAGT